MADPRLTEDELDEIREIFSHYDRNQNGVIERSEFKALLNALDADLSDAEISAGLDALDENHNGLIDFDEFVAWWANH